MDVNTTSTMFRKKNNGYRTHELVFYFAYVLYLWVSMLNAGLIGEKLGINAEILNAMKHIVAGLIVVSILLRSEFNRKLPFFILSVGLVSVLVYFNMGAFNPILAVLFLLGCRKCNPKRVCKVHFYCMLCSLGVIFASAIFGIVENRDIARVYMFDETLRYGMGFKNATWSGYIFYMFLDFFYLHTQIYKKKVKLQHYCIILFVAIIAYYLSKGRLEFVSVVLLLLAMKYYDKLMKSKVVRKIFVLSFAIMAALSIVFTYFYTVGYPFALALNRVLNSRLKFNAQGVAQYGISLFGNYVEMQGVSQTTAENWWNYFYIDNFYVSYLIQYGIIWMILVLAFLTLINKKLNADNNGRLLIFMFLIAVQGFIVPTMMDFISSCIILVAFIEVCLPERKGYKLIGKINIFQPSDKRLKNLQR